MVRIRLPPAAESAGTIPPSAADEVKGRTRHQPARSHRRWWIGLAVGLRADLLTPSKRGAVLAKSRQPEWRTSLARDPSLAKGDLPGHRRRKQVRIGIACVVDWHLVIDVGSARRVEGPLWCRAYPQHVTSASVRKWIVKGFRTPATHGREEMETHGGKRPKSARRKLRGSSPTDAGVGERSRQCEDDMEIGNGQELGPVVGQPPFGSGSLAFWAVPVAAGVVTDAQVGAGLAAFDMPAQRRRSAALYRRHELELAEAHIAGTHAKPARGGGRCPPPRPPRDKPVG